FWDWTTGRELRDAPTRPGLGHSYALTPAGRGVVESDAGDTVRLGDAATGQEQRRFVAPRPAPETTVWVSAVAVAPDSRVLAAQGGARTEDGANQSNRQYIWLCDLASGRLLHRLDDQPGHPVSTLAFSADSRTLASASQVRPVLVW